MISISFIRDLYRYLSIKGKRERVTKQEHVPITLKQRARAIESESVCVRERERKRERESARERGKMFCAKGKEKAHAIARNRRLRGKMLPIYIYIYTVIKREIDYTVRNAGQICRERPWECATSSREKRNRETCPSTP